VEKICIEVGDDAELSAHRTPNGVSVQPLGHVFSLWLPIHTFYFDLPTFKARQTVCQFAKYSLQNNEAIGADLPT
jgi:hypothetical protein